MAWVGGRVVHGASLNGRPGRCGIRHDPGRTLTPSRAIRDIPDSSGHRGARSSGIAEFTDTGVNVPTTPDPDPQPMPKPPVPCGPGGVAVVVGPARSGGHRHGGRGRRTHRRLRGPIRRSPDARVLAGVCGGLAQATGIDVTLIRIGFVLLTLGSGIGIPVYALAWLLLPLQGETTTIFSRAVNDRRGIRLVIAIIPVLVVVQILADALHIGWLGSVQLARLPGRRRAPSSSGATPARANGCGSTTTSSPCSIPAGTASTRWTLVVRIGRRRRARRRRAAHPDLAGTPAGRPCGRSAVPCWSSPPSWSSSVRGGSHWCAT